MWLWQNLTLSVALASSWQIISINVLTLRWLLLHYDPNTDGTNSSMHPWNIFWHCPQPSTPLNQPPTDHYSLPICCSPHSRQQRCNRPFFFYSGMQFCIFAGCANVSEHRSPKELKTSEFILHIGICIAVYDCKLFFTLGKLMTWGVFMYFFSRSFCVLSNVFLPSISKE